MKKEILILFSSIVLQAQDISDLGAITERRGIELERDANRVDFHHYVLEFQALRFPSNYFTITKTNDLVTLGDVMALPPGPSIMAVKEICLDGSESPLSVFRIWVHRDGPKRPGARPTNLSSKTVSGQDLGSWRRSRMSRGTNSMPPVPGGTNKPTAFLPEELPGGRNESYSDRVISIQKQMQKFYAEGRDRHL